MYRGEEIQRYAKECGAKQSHLVRLFILTHVTVVGSRLSNALSRFVEFSCRVLEHRWLSCSFLPVVWIDCNRDEHLHHLFLNYCVLSPFSMALTVGDSEFEFQLTESHNGSRQLAIREVGG